MAQRPSLQTGNLPTASPAEIASTASPARGQEMRMNLLTRLRPPPFVHQWDFWHDRQDREPSTSNTEASTPASTTSSQHSALSPATTPGTTPATTPSTAESYENRLRHLSGISDVRSFWEVFNNINITTLWLRDSVHLFHRGVKPVWEDPRNLRGGSWTFRVPKAQAGGMWTEICLMAVGEKLQEAVRSDRTAFKDDICGVSLTVRTMSCLISIWNRDASHEEGVERILAVVKEELSDELKPIITEKSCYYKRHSEHSGFKGS